MVLAHLKRFVDSMPTADERIAYLEGRFQEYSLHVTGVRADVAAVRSDVQELRTGVSADVAAVRNDLQDLRRHFETLDIQMSRQFTWLVGIQIAVLIAVIGALLRVAIS
jgi:hypothetical protein